MPRIADMPLPIQRFDEPFLPFGKALIAATQDLVVCYAFDFASYMALGAAGVVALERTLGFVGPDCIKVLHGPFHGPGYSTMADKIALNLDAITVTEHRFLPHYLSNPPFAAYSIQDDVLEEGGLYQDDAGTLTACSDGEVLHRLTLIPDALIKQNRGFEFADQIREQVMQWQPSN